MNKYEYSSTYDIFKMLKDMNPNDALEMDRQAKNKQVGGEHYLKGIEPRLYANSHNMSYEECSILRYITRHRDKKGKQDLEKAKHLLEIMIEEYE